MGELFNYNSIYAPYFNSFIKIQVIVLPQKVNAISTRATAKAVIKILLGIHMKRRCFFLMKRTARSKARATFF